MDEINEIISIADCPPQPKEKDGWYKFTVLYEEAKKEGASQEAFRRRLDQRVKDKLLEKIQYGSASYYRVKKRVQSST